ncbi:MAG: phosphate regulon transcriptional regulator PhoB [Xanthobacteraceae bacterium]|nr:phosphate regulon transcriptional regulator PhoB [Xanthobacteraceae bacterium]
MAQKQNAEAAGLPRPRVLIVEDEEPVAILLRYNLEGEGFDVSHATNGDEALLLIEENLPDAIVLDWMLPGVSGLEVCRRLRARTPTNNVPVIMLTARGEEADRVRGLGIGADDYLTKPFSVNELVARLRALLRRTKPERVASRLEQGEITLDREMHRATRAGRHLKLGPTEFRLLDFLMERPGRVFSRSQLLDGIWGMTSEIDERTVDVHIGRLRKALTGRDQRDPIRTVRGAGYAFDETFAGSSNS